MRTSKTTFKKILDDEGLTSQFVAVRTGFSRNSIQQLSRGVKQFSNENLVKIAAVLNRTPEEVFPEWFTQTKQLKTNIRVGLPPSITPNA